MELERNVDGVRDAATAGFAMRRVDAVAHAERTCRESGLRLTPIRRKVLHALVASDTPRGAYDLAEQLAQETGRRLAPITVYRALDFLVANGFVHRIESRNAFVASAQAPGGGRCLLMVCEQCGRVVEGRADAVTQALDLAAARAGFVVAGRALEVTVRCGTCA